ncbi:restriction endonuclease subunit S [Limosilactobacillus fermentum]|uniref:Restriction endonuclease subunit S n=1 Tax=Limosilactobacillus fermentum TaxID=1613 RepID=A0A843R2H4_LIMFE|nr:restriction endonuclease subunit S [Limosilactobacillus fermentum]MPQ35310.1 restriction endonuclease subunit S [Limosilactobacillus fermentum]
MKIIDSGIEWIGEVPEDWGKVKFNAIYGNRNTKVSDKDYQPLSVTKKGIVSQLDSAAKSNDNDNRKLVKVGDFVINSRSDRRGSCGISPLDGSVSLINTVLEPLSHQIVPLYFDFLFHTVQFADEFYRWGHGIVDDLWTTNWNDMKNITLILPPKSVQKQIAEYLGKKTSKIDSLIIKINDEIELLQQYQNSVITRAVTKGLDPDVPMKDSGIEWIGEIPKNWEIVKVKYLVTKLERGTAPSYTEQHKTRVVNQATFSKGFFDKSDIRYSSIPALQSRGLLQRKDVLIASTGGGVLGKVFYFNEEEEFVADSHVTIARFIPEKILPKFGFYYFSTKYDVFNYVMAQGSTNQIELKRDALANSYISVPSEKEQQQISEYLDEKVAQIQKLVKARKRQITQLTEYKNSLIFEYVTGKRQVSVVEEMD